MIRLTTALFLPALLLLPACAGGFVETTKLHLQDIVQTEEQAWTAVETQKKNCAGFGNHAPEAAMDLQACEEGLIRTHVLPVSFAPDLVRGAIADTRRTAAAYHTGSISLAEKLSRDDESWAKYDRAYNRRQLDTFNDAVRRDLSFRQSGLSFAEQILGGLGGAAMPGLVAVPLILRNPRQAAETAQDPGPPLLSFPASDWSDQ